MDVVEEQESKKKKAKPSMNIGSLLAKGRNRKNLSKQDVAEKMNLTLSTITDIEKNNYPKDTPLIFTRGYVRAYAKLIGADVESISVEFDRQTQEDQNQIKILESISPFKTRSREVNSNSFLIRTMTILIIFALISFGIWELWKRVSQSRGKALVNETTLASEQKAMLKPNEKNILLSVDSEAQIEQNTQKQLIDNSFSADVIENKTITEQNSSNIQASTTVTSTKESEQVAQPKVSRKIEKITGPKSAANFDFSGDCWVKITDINGDVLSIGIKRAGQSISVNGVAPITVILGEPSVASVSFEGKDYDLSRFQAGQRARFILQ